MIDRFFISGRKMSQKKPEITNRIRAPEGNLDVTVSVVTAAL